MRGTLALTLLIVLACHTQAVTDITTKIFDTKDKQGKTIARLEISYRGNARVMMTMSRPNPYGAMVVTSRSYLVDGNIVMIEADQDETGFFKTLAVYDTSKKEMEVFTRERDGSVKPVSSQALQAYKTQNAMMSEFWDRAFAKDMDDEETRRLLQETRKKVEDAEKRKSYDRQ